MDVPVEGLLPPVGHLHRASRAQREQAGVDLHVDVLARPERAADAGERDPHLLLREVEARRELLEVDVEPLRRRAELDTTVPGRGGRAPPSGPSAAWSCIAVS